MKIQGIILALIATACLVLHACSSSSADNILFDQTGTLLLGGSPARDGAGILFITADTTYGAPGLADDYSDYIDEGENQAEINADILITGETTLRGWGTPFPEIKFLRIRRIDP